MKSDKANEQKKKIPRQGTRNRDPLTHTFMSPITIKAESYNVYIEDLEQTLAGPVLAALASRSSYELCSADLENLFLLVFSIPSDF